MGDGTVGTGRFSVLSRVAKEAPRIAPRASLMSATCTQLGRGGQKKLGASDDEQPVVEIFNRLRGCFALAVGCLGPVLAVSAPRTCRRARPRPRTSRIARHIALDGVKYSPPLSSSSPARRAPRTVKARLAGGLCRCMPQAESVQAGRSASPMVAQFLDVPEHRQKARCNRRRRQDAIVSLTFTAPSPAEAQAGLHTIVSDLTTGVLQWK